MKQQVDVLVRLTFECDASESTADIQTRLSTDVIAGCQVFAEALTAPVVIESIIEESNLYNTVLAVDVLDYFNDGIKRFNICSDIDGDGNLSVRAYPYMPDGVTLWDSPIDTFTVSRSAVLEAENNFEI